MIIVTGATGQLGSGIVAHLLERVPAERVGVSVRDPAKAEALAERGVRVRRGDFTDPASLTTAFEGAEQVLLVSGNTLGPDGVAQHRAAIDAARAAGARRVLYTSHQAAATDSLFAPAVDHAQTEQHLAAGDVALRDGFHASSLAWSIGDAVTTGRLVAPADGPISWTAVDDLAEAAAVVLADDVPLTAPLTAPEAVDLETVAGLLSEIAGRTITRVVAPDEDYLSSMPPERAEMFLGMFRAARRGEFDVTDPTLEKLIGRPATPLRATLEKLVG